MKPLETIVYDCGAAGGMHRSWRAFAGPLKYVCFEPDPDAARSLAGNYSRNPLPGVKLIVQKSALFDSVRKVDFHIYEDVATGNNFLSSIFVLNSKITHRHKYSNIRKRVVKNLPTTSIDRIADVISMKPDFLSIDAQGAAFEILKGARHSLQNNIIGLRVEVEFIPIYRGEVLFDKIWEYLDQLGFRLIRLEKCGSGEAGISTDAGPFSKSLDDGVPIWADSIFIRSDSLLQRKDVLPKNKASFLFKYSLFCLANRCGSLSLDLILQLQKAKLLFPIVENLGPDDRHLLFTQLAKQLGSCQQSAWETDPVRLRVFRKQQAKMAELLEEIDQTFDISNG